MQVKDVHSALELEVFDEDRNKPPEFLGKVSIPLLTIRPGERRCDSQLAALFLTNEGSELRFSWLYQLI